MLTAMAIAAALCIGIGVYPAALYALLPFAVAYEPYTASHVVAQLQLLFFSSLAVFVLIRTGIYPPELRSVNLDSDWLYRKLLNKLWQVCVAAFTPARTALEAALGAVARRLYARIYRIYGPDSALARTWPTQSMALWVLVVLLGYLLLYFV
jgi:multicomponent Na+:H+ antiporter subunit D